MKTSIILALAIGLSVSHLSAQNESGKDYYVSQNMGKGRLGSKEQPAKDLAAISGFLKAGDRVHIAAGEYISKTGRGTDIIEVPVSIIGGYSDDFSTRDPWGQHPTILTGTNDYTTAETTERLAIFTDKKFRNWQGTIVVDGLIIDNGPRNRYASDKRQLLLRNASPSAGEGPTPARPGIKVRVGAQTNVEIRNCVLINSGSSQGVLEVQLGRDGKGIIENNLIVNNTGEGIYCQTNFHGEPGMPEFLVQNNTILFSWTYDGVATRGGSSLMMDTYTKVVAENNVFGFGDMGGVNNVKKCKSLQLNNNLLFGHTLFDYREFRSDFKLADVEDYAEFLDPHSSGNMAKTIQLPVNESWAQLYFGRQRISREEIDASVTVSNSDANALRSILGLNVRGNDVSKDVDIWLHQMELADGLKLGMQQYEGKGCKKP